MAQFPARQQAPLSVDKLRKTEADETRGFVLECATLVGKLALQLRALKNVRLFT